MSLNQMPPHTHRSKWESDLDGCSICIAYRRGQEAMRAACIEAVEALKLHGGHHPIFNPSCRCVGPLVISTLKEIQP